MFSRPASITSDEEECHHHHSRTYFTPNPPASYLYREYNNYCFSIEAARTWVRAWETEPEQARLQRRTPSPDDYARTRLFGAYSFRGRQETRRSSACRSINPALYRHAEARAARMSEGDNLSRALGNIDIGLETIEEELAADSVNTTAEASASFETGLSSTFSQLTLDTTAARAGSSTQNINESLTETAADTSSSEKDSSTYSLNHLTSGAAAPEAISSTTNLKESSTTTGRLFFVGDLDSLRGRGADFVVYIHPEFHNLGAIRSTPEKPEPILETYTDEIREDKTIPLDSIPNILWSKDEVELLKSLHHPLIIQLDSGFAEMQEAMEQSAWLEKEGGNSVPMTPLTHTFRPTKASKFEKANGDVQIMHLEDFSPAEHHVPLEILKNVLRKATPSISSTNAQSQVQPKATIEKAEADNVLDDVMSSVRNENDDEVVEEESDSSVEIILDKLSPVNGLSTSIGYHRKPREMKPWTDAHEASKLYRKFSSGYGISGANYKLRNVSNITLGDMATTKTLDRRTSSFPATLSTIKTITGSENRTGKSAAVKISNPLTRKANNSTSKSGKGRQTHKRSPSDAVSDLDTFNKGKKVAKTPSKRSSSQSPQVQANLPMQSASELPEYKVDCGNTTGSDSDFSIDINLEDCDARGRILSRGSFFPKSLSAPSFTTSTAPSGGKENDNLKVKATKITGSLLSSPIASPSSQNRVISYASVAATPLPVRKPLEPKHKS